MDNPNEIEIPRIGAMVEEAELLAEAVVDTVTDSLLLLDSGLRVKFANRSFYRTFSVVPRDTIGQLVYELGNAQWDVPKLRGLLEDVLPTNGRFEDVDVAHTFPAIGYKVMRLSGRKLERRPSQQPLILLAIVDVTERERALDALHASEERYRTLVETAQDGIWTIDGAGNTTFANPSMARMLGTTVEEMIGQPSFAYVFEEDADRASELFGEKMSGAREPFEFRLRRKDGSWFWASVAGAAFHNARGEPVGLLGAFRDITERKLAEEAAARHADELARSNADLQHFAHATSHDLREPLRTMCAYAQLLLRQYGGKLDDDADQFLGFIAAGAERMDKLINDLLSYSQATERDGCVVRPVELQKTVDWARKNLATTIKEAGAEIAHDPLPTVNADELQLVQMFQNLLSNAVKYARPGEPPRVHIAAQLRGNEWIVTVRDNGIGVPADKREHIFGIFKRLHGPEIPGTGIGLAICRKIAENHGGRIWVDSHPDGGSVFSFSIPVAEER